MLKRDPILRPLTWRLPLLAFLLVGILGLAYIDRLLAREYREQATTQAVHARALLDSYLRQRIALLRGVSSLVESAGSLDAIETRLVRQSARVFQGSSDVRTIAYADANGRIRATYPDTGSHRSLIGASMLEYSGRADATEYARRTKQPAVTRTIRLRNGDQGIVIVDPIVRSGRVIGYLAGAFAHASIFREALGGQLLGHFAYQVRDYEGRVIGRSPEYPSRVTRVERQAVTLPGGYGWTIEVAVPRYEPFFPRLLNGLAGSMLLLVLVLLVVREEAQSRRFAERTAELEILSRDLLDANLRLEERARQIADANRAKSRFLANVSHELRTPLNAIVGYNSLARDGVYGDLTAPLLVVHERIAAAAEHLLGLVNDVLDLSKIEVGRMEVDRQPVDVASVVDSVVTVIEPMAEAKRLRVDVLVARDLPRIITDPGHVRQILLNLTANAVKFTERGSIAIVARRRGADDGAGVAIMVEDSGIGIAADDHERIFLEFEQVRPSGRGDSLQRGTGLGLAISRKLARLLGGDVTVQSRIGAGSRFTLSLPLESPEVRVTSEEASAAAPVPVDSELAVDSPALGVPRYAEPTESPRDVAGGAHDEQIEAADRP